jgi:hypothetical protein
VILTKIDDLPKVAATEGLLRNRLVCPWILLCLDLVGSCHHDALLPMRKRPQKNSQFVST